MHTLVVPSWYPMHYASISGIFFREQAQALHDHGLKVGVIYPNLRRLRTVGFGRDVLRDHFQVTAHVESGILEYKLHAWNPVNSRLRLWAFRIGCRRLMRKYIQDHGLPDLIHAHCAVWGGVAAQDLAEKFDVPYVITEHSSAFLRGKIDEWQKPYIRGCFDAADAVWAVSSALRRGLQPFVEAADVDVVPNMVDTTFFQSPSRPRDASPFIFLSVGSLKPNKGIDLLLRAFAKLARTGTDVELAIAGDGEEKVQLRTLAARLGVQEHVRFLGRLSREEVRRAMWRANALTSTSHVETFGVVLIEAMATGLPVVATQSGGPCDIVRSEVGTLVPTGDVQALFQAMNQMAKTDFDETQIRSYVKRSYSTETVTGRIKSSYRTVIGNASTE